MKARRESKHEERGDDFSRRRSLIGRAVGLEVTRVYTSSGFFRLVLHLRMLYIADVAAVYAVVVVVVVVVVVGAAAATSLLENERRVGWPLK